MLKKLRADHPYIYSICMMFVFWAGLYATAYIVAWLEAYGVISLISPASELLNELGGFAAVALFLHFTGRLELITNRGCGLLKGMFIGGAMLVYELILLALQVSYVSDESQLMPPVHIFFFIVSNIAVGLAEETVARAAIGETILEHYGADRRGVWLACITSGVTFGLLHIVNASFGDIGSTLIQCGFTTLFGIYFAAIYFRSGNLWVVILLHGFRDIIGMFDVDGIYASAMTEADLLTGYDWTSIVQNMWFILPAIFLLRGSKIAEVEKWFGKYCKEKADV